MAEAETSDARLAKARESTFGVNPATGAKFLRITSDSFQENQGRTKSEEVTGSRNPRQNIRTSVDAGGGVDFEFSVVDIDTTLEDALMAGAFPAAPAAVSATLGAVAATQKFTSTITDLSGIVKGQWFRVAGMAAANNNGLFCAAANSTTTEIQVLTGSGLTDATEASGKTVQESRMLRPGSTLISSTFERQWTDISLFELFTGMVLESLEMRMASEAVITGSATYVGKEAPVPAGTSAIGTVAAAGTKDVAATVEALRGFREGSLAADSAYRLTEIALSLSNATRLKREATSLTPFDIGLGIIDVQFTLSIYLSGSGLHTKYKNNTLTPISFRIEGPGASDSDYIFTAPSCRITDLSNPITGNSEDGFVNATFMAETDADGVAFQVDIVPAI